MDTALQRALEPLFEENFARYGELGASVSVWRGGVEVVHLEGGWRDRGKTEPWDERTIALVYSATKGPAAACVLRCLAEAGLSLDAPVASVWPEFAAAGKAGLSFGEILSHRGGLPALDDPPDIFDYPAVIRALENQRPFWHRGEGHGYHPRTSGFLWDEVVRRVTGIPLGTYWRQAWGEPLGLNFWIGLPPERLADAATLSPARTAPADDDFLRAFAEPDSLTQRAFASPRGLFSVSSMNTREARTASFPAFGGIGSASALARFYSVLAEEAELWMAAAASPLAAGFDRILRLETAFSAGFMQDPTGPGGEKRRRIFGPSRRAFGQPGAGGSFAFADPDRQLGFAYVMNQMEPGVLPNQKSIRLVDAMYRLLEAGEQSPA